MKRPNLFSRVFVITTTLCPVGYALHVVPLVDQQATTLSISKDHQNRIAVAGDRIEQIFGAEGRFEVQTDDTGGQIFLTPLPGQETPFTLTLITEGGQTQDLHLHPKAIGSQSILFKSAASGLETAPEPNLSLEDQSSLSLEDQRLDVMVAFLKGHIPEGFERVENLPDPRSAPEGLSLTPKTQYRGHRGGSESTSLHRHEIEVLIYEIHNTGDEPQDFDESDWAEAGDLAIYQDASNLQPGTSTHLMILRTT